MHQIHLQEVGSRLAELLDEVASGEEVIITRPNGGAFKIVAVESVASRPKYGSAKGKVKMSDDFDEPLADFQEYMP